MTLHTILWRNAAGGHERAVLAPDPKGFHLSGTALYAVEGAPVEVRYSILTDREWNTRVVGVHVQTGAGNRRLALHGDGAGGWTIGDEPHPAVAGPHDVDLAFTPATNTLPINRLALDVGAAADVTVVYVDPLGDDLDVATHRYERIAADRYRFRGATVDVELTVDDRGLVTAYPGFWEAIAAS